MTTHSQPVSTTPRRSRTRRRNTDAAGEKSTTHDPMSVAKMTMFGTIAAALIAALPHIVDAVYDSSGDVRSTPITEIQGSDRGSIDQVTVSDSGTKVTVSGSANPFVEAVGVVISEPKATEPLLRAITNVTDGKWDLVATTEQEIPWPFDVQAVYKERTATVTKASSLTFRLDPPVPPPPPGPQDGCTTQTIENCFSGPGWGSPSIYRSES